MADILNTAALAKLEPFLLMAKSAKGAAATKLIQDAISAPGVFVFAELLDMPSVQELAKNEQHNPWYSVLQLFSYGTYQDYKASASKLPKLSPTQITKLKYLTLATLAQRARVLHYTTLQSALDIKGIRDLEDLIIEAMYQDVIHGKLDQQQSILEVQYSMGRDLRPDELGELLGALKEWSKTTSSVLDALDKEIERIQAEEKGRGKVIGEHEKVFHENLREVYDKAKGGHGHAGGGKAYGRRERGAGGGGVGRSESMDVDEVPEMMMGMGTGRGGSSNSTEPLQLNKKPPSSDKSAFPRKRTRGT